MEKVGIQFIKLILGVILARLLTPADYGLIGMITVFFAIALVFIDGGLGLAYIQKEKVNENDASTIFYFNLILSLVFYIILWFSAPLIAVFYGQDQLVDLTRAMGLVLLINSFGLIQLTLLTREVDFKKKTIIILLSSVIASISGIIAALNGYGVWSLVVQEIVRATIKSTGLWFFHKWRPLWSFKISSLVSLFSFSSWALLMGIINTIFNNIYILTIGKFFPASELGFYTKAKQFRGILSQTPSNAMGTVAFPVLSRLQNDKVALKNAMRKFIKYALFYIAPLSAIFMIIAKPFFLILLTSKWLPMVPYFQLLLIVGLFFPIHMINVQALSAQGKMKLNFNISMIKNVLRILNILIMYKYSVLYIIYGELVLSVLALGINTYYSWKMVDYGLMSQLKDVFKILATSIMLTFAGMYFVSWISDDYFKVLFGIIFISTGYLMVIYFVERNTFKENLQLLQQRLKF